VRDLLRQVSHRLIAVFTALPNQLQRSDDETAMVVGHEMAPARLAFPARRVGRRIG